MKFEISVLFSIILYNVNSGPNPVPSVSTEQIKFALGGHFILSMDDHSALVTQLCES